MRQDEHARDRIIGQVVGRPRPGRDYVDLRAVAENDPVPGGLCFGVLMLDEERHGVADAVVVVVADRVDVSGDAVRLGQVGHHRETTDKRVTGELGFDYDPHGGNEAA